MIGVGDTMVVKLSEFTCGATQRLAALIREAGIPEGVVNVVREPWIKPDGALRMPEHPEG